MFFWLFSISRYREKYSNQSYLKELGKRNSLKKKFVQNGPSVQILDFGVQNLFFFCKMVIVCFCSTFCSNFGLLKVEIEALGTLKKNPAWKISRHPQGA